MPAHASEVAEREGKRIERRIGEAKQWHGLGQARFLVEAKLGLQTLMTFLVLNVKRIVKLLVEQPNARQRQLCRNIIGKVQARRSRD